MGAAILPFPPALDVSGSKEEAQPPSQLSINQAEWGKKGAVVNIQFPSFSSICRGQWGAASLHPTCINEARWLREHMAPAHFTLGVGRAQQVAISK